MIIKKRGPIISIIGLVFVAISLSITSSIVPNNISEINNLSDSILEGMFDEISDEIQILSGDSAYFSHSISSSDVLMWGVRIVDYQPGDELSINISNIYGDDYGVYLQNESVLFEMLKIAQSDTVNLEVKNIGIRNVDVIAMFSENPDPFSNTDSSTMNVVLVLTISGFLLILGIIVSVIGIIVLLVDLKNNQNNKRSY